VTDERIAGIGLEAVSLEEGFKDADAALILNDHAGYRSEHAHRLIGSMRTPILFDAWGVFHDQLSNSPDNGMTYLRLGIG
jgi:UDP-N-acetyl-D-mannosaminuronic acid dehydrogenase